MGKVHDAEAARFAEEARSAALAASEDGEDLAIKEHHDQSDGDFQIMDRVRIAKAGGAISSSGDCAGDPPSALSQCHVLRPPVVANARAAARWTLWPLVSCR